MSELDQEIRERQAALRVKAEAEAARAAIEATRAEQAATIRKELLVGVKAELSALRDLLIEHGIESDTTIPVVEKRPYKEYTGWFRAFGVGPYVERHRLVTTDATRLWVIEQDRRLEQRPVDGDKKDFNQGGSYWREDATLVAEDGQVYRGIKIDKGPYHLTPISDDELVPVASVTHESTASSNQHAQAWHHRIVDFAARALPISEE